MDFGLDDTQLAAIEVADQILAGTCAPERLRQIEDDDWFHATLWAELAKADLLGLCLPEADGGGGFGFLEACLLLERIGRYVPPVPALDGVVAAMAIGRWGTPELRDRWLGAFAAGDAVLTLALSEATGDERHPALRAERRPDGWVLTGDKICVPFAERAAALVVSARDTAGDPIVVVVPAEAAGVAMAGQDTFNHEPQAHVTFDGVHVEDAALLGGDDATLVLDWLVDRAAVALAALAAGIADGGMRLTATYTTERHQFDRAIGTFQAVGHRMADCFIDVEAMRLTMLQAATLLDDESPADLEVAVAKYWASYGGSRVGHAGLHVHGGISIDLDYPIHRYFLWAKHLELRLGAGTAQLDRLGSMLAEAPVLDG